MLQLQVAWTAITWHIHDVLRNPVSPVKPLLGSARMGVMAESPRLLWGAVCSKLTGSFVENARSAEGLTHSEMDHPI